MKLYKDIKAYGQRIEKLGVALQDGNSTLLLIQNLAEKCGMDVFVLLGKETGAAKNDVYRTYMNGDPR